MHEDILKRLLDTLKSVFDTRLISFVMYGSSHTGEYHKRYSNINTIVLVKDVHTDDIIKLGKEIIWFLKDDNPAPLIFTENDISSYKDVFPIEMLDIIENHTVVYGDDPFKDLQIDKTNLRFQCEYELKSKLLLLRQSLFNKSSRRRVQEIMLNTLPGIVALFKGVLRLKDQEIPARKKETIEKLSQFIGFVPSGLLKMLSVRQGNEILKKSDVYAVMDSYIQAIVKVLDFIETIERSK